MELLSKKTLIMVLCGGKGERLYPLTRDRAKPSVPFLGAYRIIDFSLSNALNSGLRRIALLTQYKSLSLERHILNGWNIFHAESGDYIISLPAQGRVSDHWYEGTADAVFQNIYTIQQENPEAVLVPVGGPYLQRRLPEAAPLLRPDRRRRADHDPDDPRRARPPVSASSASTRNAASSSSWRSRRSPSRRPGTRPRASSPWASTCSRRPS